MSEGNFHLPPWAEDYYDVQAAKRFLAKPVKEGCRRWQCVLCGFPQGDFPAADEYIGASCCGGCGQSCVRPIDEYIKYYGQGDESTA